MSIGKCTTCYSSLPSVIFNPLCFSFHLFILPIRRRSTLFITWLSQRPWPLTLLSRGPPRAVSGAVRVTWRVQVGGWLANVSQVYSLIIITAQRPGLMYFEKTTWYLGSLYTMKLILNMILKIYSFRCLYTPVCTFSWFCPLRWKLFLPGVWDWLRPGQMNSSW